MNNEKYDELIKQSEKIAADLKRMKKEMIEIMPNPAIVQSRAYSMIYSQSTNNIAALGIGKNEKGSKYYHYLCHSCEVGLRSESHDSIVLRMVAHLAGERHMILLESD